MRTVKMMKLDFLIFRRFINSIFVKNKLARVFQGIIFLFLILYLISIQAYGYIYCTIHVSLESAQTVIYFVTFILNCVCCSMLFSPMILDSNDYQLLMVLPLSKKIFLKSRILHIYKMNLLFSLLTMIPAVIMHIYCGGKGTYWLKTILGIIFVSFLTVCFVQFLISLCKYMYHKKRRYKIVCFGIVLVILAYITFIITNILFKLSTGHVTENLINHIIIVLTDRLSNYLVPLNYIVLVEQRALTGFFLTIVTAFLLIMLTYNCSYCYLELKAEAKEQIEIQRSKRRNRKNAINLFTREWWVIRKYKGYLPHFIMEIFLAPMILLYLLGLIKICGIFSPQIGEVVELLEQFEYGIYVLLLVINLMILSQSSCLAPVSREGKLYWLTRVLPISSDKLYLNKCRITLIMTEISGLLSYLVIVLTGVIQINNTFTTYILLFMSIYACISFASLRDYKSPYISWESVKKMTNANVNIFWGMLKVMIWIFIECLAFIILRLLDYSFLQINLVLTGFALLIGSCIYMRMSRRMKFIYSSYDVKI